MRSRSAPREGVLLEGAVAAHAQEQGDRRQVVDEDLDAASDRRPQPVVRRPRPVRLGPVEDGAEVVERLVQRLLEQVALARHVVVDRGLAESQLGGQVAHAGRVVPLAVEQVDGAAEHRRLVVAGPAPPSGRLALLCHEP